MNNMKPEPVEEPPDKPDLTLHLPADCEDLPSAAEVGTWVELVLAELAPQTAAFAPDGRLALGVAVIAPELSRSLNLRYRRRDRPTNVLSFPLREPDEAGRLLLGDLLLCAEVLREEATSAGLSLRERFAQLLVHGLLHLLGHDHEEAAAAEVMEGLESRLLCRLGFADPWREANGSRR